MFGCFVRTKFFLLIVGVVTVQASAAPQKTNAIIVVEEGTVFREPSFESEVIGTFPGDHKVLISKEKKGPFYKILVKPGLVGWISDGEVQPLQQQKIAARPGQGKSTKKSLGNAPATKKTTIRLPPLQYRGLLGLIYDGVQFQEETMGKVRSSYLPMWGVRWSGPNTMMTGDIAMDSQFLFLSGAPSHYAEATGNSASGFLLLASTVFVTDIPISNDLMVYYGFGPMVRINQIHTKLQNDPFPGTSSRYDLEDIVLGAVFQGGVAVGLSTWVLRLDGYYHWELRRYPAFALSVQTQF